MLDRSQSVISLTLAGQVLLEPNPACITVPSCAQGALADQIRSAQTTPGLVRQEYTRLFLNPAGVECYLWQSVHAVEPRLFGPPHHSTLEWFRRYGAESHLANQPADHLGLLLLFYARLIENGEPEEITAAFFREHIAWAAEFASKLKQITGHPLYLALARELLSLFP